MFVIYYSYDELMICMNNLITDFGASSRKFGDTKMSHLKYNSFNILTHEMIFYLGSIFLIISVKM